MPPYAAFIWVVTLFQSTHLHVPVLHRIGVNTFDERRSKIIGNRVVGPDWRQMTIENTVSSDLRSAFVDC